MILARPRRIGEFDRYIERDRIDAPRDEVGWENVFVGVALDSVAGIDGEAYLRDARGRIIPALASEGVSGANGPSTERRAAGERLRGALVDIRFVIVQ